MNKAVKILIVLFLGLFLAAVIFIVFIDIQFDKKQLSPIFFQNQSHKFWAHKGYTTGNESYRNNHLQQALHDSVIGVELDVYFSTELQRLMVVHDFPIQDTIFLDVLMSSKGTGCSAPAYQMALSLNFISRIKKDKNFSNINVIIYSGQKDEILKEEALKIGVDAYLTKGEIMPKEIIAFTDKIHGHNN